MDFPSYFSDHFSSNQATGANVLAVASSPVSTASVVKPARPVPQTSDQWGNLFGSILGPPRRTTPDRDQIVSDIWVQPYRSPFDGIDPYGCETPRMVRHYNEQYRNDPIVRAAIRGKADDICILEPAVLAQDRNDPVQAKAAEFVKWTIEMGPGGWFGLFDSILTPGLINGWSICEKKRKVCRWKGEVMQGFGHVRNLDTAFLRLELDVYRNVLAVVNMVRGLEYYEPDDVILYSHNPMYSNPFGQSDIRSVTRAADIMQDAYRVWFVAMTVYGLPYMVAKGPATNKEGLSVILQELRAGGYAVTGVEDEIEVLNLAASTGSDIFKDFVHINRENIFFGIRGVAQPFMEGDGGADSHTDTDIQQGTSDAGERAVGHRLAAVINEQVIPWLVFPNFGAIDYPRLKLGGTDWKQIKDIVGIYKDAQAVGAKPSAEQFYAQTSIVPQRDESDALVAPSPGGPGGAAGGMPGQPGNPTGGAPQLPPHPAEDGTQKTPEPKMLPSSMKPMTPMKQATQPKQATFSDGHKPSKVDPATVSRVVSKLFEEMAA